MQLTPRRICTHQTFTRGPSGRVDVARKVVNACVSMMLIVAFGLLSSGNSWAQPPGTTPPEKVFGEVENELPINAFLFLNESKNQVVMPELTWEELQRLQDLEAGRDQTGGRYSFESIHLKGEVTGSRAEVTIKIKIAVQATGNQYATVPLRMRNFHQIEAPQIDGVDSAMIDIAGDGSGYELKVKSPRVKSTSVKSPSAGKASSEVTVTMKVAARVQSTPSQQLELNLPFAAAKIELIVPVADANGEVIGSDDETIQTVPLDNNRSKLIVDSSGGNFSLHWGRANEADQVTETVEVESRMTVRWDSPQDQPVASVRMTARSVKGSIRGFQIKLPPGAVVQGTPRLGASGQIIELRPVSVSNTDNGNASSGKTAGDNASGSNEPADRNAPSSKPSRSSKTRGSAGSTSQIAESNLREVVIPKEEYQNRIDLNFELQLAGALATSDSPLMMQVPEVVGALRHRGEIVFNVGREYRLRWSTVPWVRSDQSEIQDDSSANRVYPFRFDRGSFQLPVWLSTGTRRLQLNSQAELTIRDSLATMEMNIDVNGSAINSRLRIDPASWEIGAVERFPSGDAIEWFESESLSVIELGAVSGVNNQSIRIVATLPIGQDIGEVSFPLPRIVSDRDEFVLRQSTIDLIRNGRTMMVVDLAASDGLSRMVTSSNVGDAALGGNSSLELSESRRDARISRFRISPSELAPFLAGILVDQPPQVSLATQVDVDVNGDSLVTRVQWDLDSSFDLEGRIPIQIPYAVSIKSDSESNSGLSKSGSRLDGGPDDPQISGLQRNGLAFEDRFGGSSSNGGSDWDNDEEAWNVTVDGLPATLRSLNGDRYELISDRLSEGTMQIQWWHVAEFPESRKTLPQPVSLPRPNLNDVTLRGKVDVTMHGTNAASWTAVDYPASAVEPIADQNQNSHRLSLDNLPREPIRLRLQANQTDGEDQSVLRTILRTAYGTTTRHEQLLMTFQGGEELRIRLPAVSRNRISMESITAEAEIDQKPVRVNAADDQLIIALPADGSPHQLDLRLWASIPAEGSVNRVEPLMKLPIGVGRVYWQIIAPLDGHVMWASPSVGRGMSWRFDRWRLYREPSFNDQVLTALAGGTTHTMPSGNPYLYVGSDLSEFEVVVFSRTILWGIVAAIVIGLSALLMYFPITRHPATAILVGVAFAYLLVRAPDAAVLSGQFGIISLVLVVVMITVRSLLSGNHRERLFDAPRTRSDAGTPAAEQNSTKTQSPPVAKGEITETQAYKPSSRFPAKAGSKS